MPRTCVVMCSGGLDSLLALGSMVRQGLRTIAFHGVSVFHDKAEDEGHLDRLRAQLLRIGADEVVFRDQTDAMIAFTNHPRFGYGKHLNACIDCRIMTIATAKTVMDETKADFIASGEVIGQRPMSQRRDAMRTVEREIASLGLDGLLLRPLCAKLLDPTIPETEGWVDRESLFDFEGRNRKPQMALAREWGITDYPTPAGGCLLTDEGFSNRLRDLMENTPGWSADDVRLLRIGRHYRISPATKIVVCRNEDEANRIKELTRPGDTFLSISDRPGALVLVRGLMDDEARRIATGLAVHYSKLRNDDTARVHAWPAETDLSKVERDDLGLCARVDPNAVQNLYIGVWQPG